MAEWDMALPLGVEAHMNENPWMCWNQGPSFVHPDDSHALEKVDPTFLDLGVPPNPFVGRQDAPLVLLGNIAGLSVDRKDHRRPPYRVEEAFVGLMRKNLHHENRSPYPFVFFDPRIWPLSGHFWDHQLCNLLAIHGGGESAREILARNIFTIEFFPYVSISNSYDRKLDKIRLPSQQYSFRLVEKAMEQNAVIAIRYGKDRWLEHVNTLGQYPRLVLLETYSRGILLGPTTCRGSDWSLLEQEVGRMT